MARAVQKNLRSARESKTDLLTPLPSTAPPTQPPRSELKPPNTCQAQGGHFARYSIAHRAGENQVDRTEIKQWSSQERPRSWVATAVPGAQCDKRENGYLDDRPAHGQ